MKSRRKGQGMKMSDRDSNERRYLQFHFKNFIERFFLFFFQILGQDLHPVPHQSHPQDPPPQTLTGPSQGHQRSFRAGLDLLLLCSQAVQYQWLR